MAENRPIVEFDVETSGFQWYSPAQQLGLVQFYSPELEPEPVVLDPRNRRERDVIQAWFDRDAWFRGWNTKFDWHWAEDGVNGGFRVQGDRMLDGMVAAVLLDEKGSAALKARGESLFGPASRDPEKAVKAWLAEENKRRRKLSKETGERFIPASYLDVPRNIMDAYALQDVILGRRIGDVQDLALANSPELAALYETEMQVMAALYAAERHGFPMDEGSLRRLELGLVEELQELEEQARELAGIRSFNPRSPQQVYEALKRLGADLSFVTGTSMDAENLATVPHPLARIIERHRQAAKLLGTYVQPMLREKWITYGGTPMLKQPYIVDGRLHTTFKQVGAKTTGRMSSADPNVQNLPRDDLRIRYAVRAEPGMKLVTADLSSIELVLFAAFVGEGRMMNLIRDPDGDPHTAAADAVGLDDFDRGGGVVESRRQRGKTWNYMTIYGGGTRTVRKTYRVNQKKAREMIEGYHKAFPEIRRFQRMIEYRLYDRGYVKSIYGRRFRVDPRDAYKAVNYLIQGTAADMLKKSIAELQSQGVPIIGAVHDELIAHVPEKDAEEVAHLIEKALTNHPAITERVPVHAEAQIVDRWSDAKKPGYVPEYEQMKDAA